MLVIFLIVTGIPAYFLIVRELFPILPQDRIGITTIYPDASPEDIEKQITAEIESAIAGVDGIRHISSVSVEGISMINLELEVDADPDDVIRDVQAEIDTIDTFPDDAEDPRVEELKYNWPVVNLTLHGPVSEKRMKKIAEDLKDSLVEIPGVAQIMLGGIREREIHVLADMDRLYAYRISLPILAQALIRGNRDLPAGKLETSRQEFLVRTQEDFTQVEEIRRAIVRVNERGGKVTVGDVATVVDTFADRETFIRMKGNQCVGLFIMKQSNADTLRLKRRIDEVVDRFLQQIPEPITVDPFLDFSFAIRERLDVMQFNGMLGLALVLGFLCLFLDIRIAMMVAIGIPFSFLGAILLMSGMGMSLNMLTMFGAIIVLGMLVDDAIIIAENSYRYLERGWPRAKAAIAGANEVTMPVLAAVLTTISAFLPLLLMEGLLGKFLGVIPIVVTFALVASLLEAFVILPSHIAEWSQRISFVKHPHAIRKKARNRYWYAGVIRFYRRALLMCLRYRYLAVLTIILLAIAAVWFAYYGMDFILIQNRDINYFRILVEMPVGAPLDRTSDAMQKLEELALQLPENEIEAVVAYVGLQIDEWNQLHLGSHYGQIWVDLTETKWRDRVGMETLEEYRRLLPPMPEIKSLSLEKEVAGPPAGKAVSVRIRGENFALLRQISREMQDFLHTIDGVVDIRDDFTEGKTELRIKLDRPRASQLGFTPEEIAAAVRYTFDGGKAGRLFDQDEGLDIMVRAKKSNRSRIEDISNLRFLNANGDWIPFENFATLMPGRGVSQITRFDNRRSITVSADVETEKITSMEANRLLRERFAASTSEIPAWKTATDMFFGQVQTSLPCKERPGYTLTFGGENEETQRSLSSLLRAFVVSFVLIYFILAAVFRSYIQPMVVLLTVPFSFIGVIIGLFVMGEPIGIMALIGVISLNGIVVNDAIVLVDFINQSRRRGLGRWRSVYKSGILRIRPIILTSVTTIGGLLPLTAWVDGTSEFLSPMAIAISWGLAFATLLTLLVLPCAFSILDDIKIRLRVSLVPSTGPEESSTLRNGSLPAD
jgi:multidrug efflux pump subunit AcrB